MTKEHVARAREISHLGASNPTIAKAIGVPLRTLELWLQMGRSGKGSELHDAFLRAIQEGEVYAEINALKVITSSDDFRAAAWYLTHNRNTRDRWSDAAAERKTERRTVATMLEAVAASGLTPDQERTLLLQMQARGLGAVQQEEEGEA